MNLDTKIPSCEEISEELKQKLASLPRIKTCEHSLLPKGRLWCINRNARLIRGYCETCLKYQNEILGVYAA